jgi:hypothetical protein
MMRYLRYDTAVEVVVGPLLSYLDGVTPVTSYGDLGDITAALVDDDGARTALTLTGAGGGTNDFVHEADGYWMLELTEAQLTLGRQRLTLRDDDGILPVWEDFMVIPQNVYDWMVEGTESITDVGTLLARLGAFTGSGANTVLGLLRAAMRKDLTAPSDVGGNFDPQTDSEESIREHIDRMAGAGFSGSSSLKNLRVAIGASSIASTSAATVATGTLSVRSNGYLDRVIRTVRKSTDERTTMKYDDTDIVDLMILSWSQIWSDLKLLDESKPRAEYGISIVEDVRDYFLPPTVGEIHRIAKINETTGLPDWELYPRGQLNPSGYGFRIEGNLLRLSEKWKEGYSLTLEYVPNGEAYPHESRGKLTWTTATSPSFTLATTNADGGDTIAAVTGTLDRRPNAYGGYMIRIFGDSTDAVAGMVFEAMVDTFDAVTMVATLRTGNRSPEEFGFAVNTHYGYEVVPPMGVLIRNLVALKTALRILADQTNHKAYQLLNHLYDNDLRSVRLELANRMQRRAQRHEGDSVDNRNFRRPRMLRINT